MSELSYRSLSALVLQHFSTCMRLYIIEVKYLLVSKRQHRSQTLPI